mgnify:CR=1 FL=1
MAENNMKWYVLKSISGKEQKVKEYIETACRTADLDQFVSQVLIPTEKVVALRGGKRVVKEKVLLPGYVLVECNLTDECYPRLRNVPNVLGFLSTTRDQRPTPVRQAEINKLFGTDEQVEETVFVEENFIVGDKVKVTDGPFNDFSGTVEEVMSDKKKLKVIVTIFDRQTPLELSFNQGVKEKETMLRVVGTTR